MMRRKLNTITYDHQVLIIRQKDTQLFKKLNKSTYQAITFYRGIHAGE